MGMLVIFMLAGGFIGGIQFHRLWLRKLHRVSVKIGRIQRGR